MSVILLWVFIGALFADGANLDDLLPGFIVIHDDDEIIADDASGAIPCQSDGSNPLPVPTKQHPPSSPAPVARVIIDQDSPSLAPEPCVQAHAPAGFRNDEQNNLVYWSPTSGELYLRFCSLLI